MTEKTPDDEQGATVESWEGQAAALRREQQFDAAPVTECPECGTIWSYEDPELDGCPGCSSDTESRESRIREVREMLGFDIGVESRRGDRLEYDELTVIVRELGDGET